MSRYRFTALKISSLVPALTLSLMAALGQGACAAPAAAPPTALRLLLKPAPGTDAAQGLQGLIDQVSKSAQVPRSSVTYLADSGGQWHAVSVLCANTARCDEVFNRLQADTSHFAAVSLDQPQRAIPRSTAP
jgi:hypothetical protein